MKYRIYFRFSGVIEEMSFKEGKSEAELSYIILQFTATPYEDTANTKISRELGFTLRGAFGIALKKLVCHNIERNCSTCLLKSRCPYTLIFEGLPPDNREFMRKYNFIPQPFIFSPIDGRFVSNDGKLHFELKLFGPTADLYPYIIVTIDNMLKRGLGKDRIRFILNEVFDTVANKTIYQADQNFLKPPKTKKISLNFENSTPKPTSVYLKSITPAHIRTNGKFNPKPSIEDIIRSVIRRIKIIHHFYGNNKNDILEPELVNSIFNEVTNTTTKLAQYRQWSIDRFSTRQNRRMKMQGVLFELILSGEFTYLYNLLKFAEQINIGKYTSFSLGKIEVGEHI